MMGRLDKQSTRIIQDAIFALVTKDVEALTNASLALGKPAEKVNRSKLMDDIDTMVSRHGSTRSLQDIDLGSLMTKLTDLMAEHKISMPGEYTMFVRSLATFEGVIETLCPGFDLMGFLAKKLIGRMQQNADAAEQLGSMLEAIASTGMRAARLPGLASEALNNLVKDRMKIVLEPAGLDEPIAQAKDILLSVTFAVFACVLFLGSAILCMAPIEPQTNGVPLVSLVGFIASVALGLHAISRMMKKK